MTSTTLAPTPPAPAPRRGADDPARHRRAPGASLPRVVLSEWTKLRSLRSTWAVLAVALVLSLGLGALIALAISDTSQPPPRGGPAVGGLADPVAAVLSGTSMAALVFGVLGALTASGEYSTGSITASLTAVPRRWPVLAAKAVVLVAVVGPVSLALSAGAVWLGGLVLGDAATISWSDPDTVRALAGSTAYLTGMSLLGLGLAVLLRSAASSITVLVALVFVLPVLLPILSWDWVGVVADHLPGTVGQALQATLPAAISDGEAAWTLLAWTIAPLTAAAVVLQRRDA